VVNLVCTENELRGGKMDQSLPKTDRNAEWRRALEKEIEVVRAKANQTCPNGVDQET
jgi:hypothetical protein